MHSILYLLNLPILLFIIGISGIILSRKNIIIILMSIEMLLLSINLIFIIFSLYLNDIHGIIFSIIVLTIAAAESAVGLAILVSYYRTASTILITKMNLLGN